MNLKIHFTWLPRLLRDIGLFLGGIIVSTVAGIIIDFWAIAWSLFRWAGENVESCSQSIEETSLHQTKPLVGKEKS